MIRKRNFSLTKMGILEEMQYRGSMYVLLFGNLLYLVLIYFLWKAIFASAGCDTVNGMTFELTMVYLVLATALYGVMEMYIVWQIGRDIQSGKIVLDLLRPMKYKKFMFWSISGALVVHFVVVFVPTFVIVFIVSKGTIKFGINILYFLVSVVLAMIINFNIDFIVGTICLHTDSIWGINIMKQVIVALLSGATIPLAFFPERIVKIVDVLPFKSIYDTPLMLLLGNDDNIEKIFSKLLISLMWAIVMSIISSVFWKISIKQVTVNGG